MKKKIKNIRFNNTIYICVHGFVENEDSTNDNSIEANYVFMKVENGDYLSTPRKSITQRNSLANLEKDFPEQLENETLLALKEI